MTLKESNLVPGTGANVGDRTKLSMQQKVFIREYLVDGDGKRAASVAGYRHPAAMASRMLNREKYPLIAAEIDKGTEVNRQNSEIEGKRVIQELGRIALVNPKMLLDDKGFLKELKDLPDEIAAAVRSVSVSYSESEDDDGTPVRVRTVNVDFCDKLRALQQLVAVLGLAKNEGGNITQNNVYINWNDLTSRPPIDASDIIEQQITEMQSRALPPKEQP